MEIKLPSGQIINEHSVPAAFPDTLWPSPERIVPEMLHGLDCEVVLEVPAPVAGQYQSVERVGAEQVDGHWQQKWLLRTWSEEAIAAAQADEVAQLVQSFTSALEEHYDKVAQLRHYDNRLTCALRAGYQGPFQQEGVEFAVWMDTCNVQGYRILHEVQSGTRALPTFESVLAELPALNWL